MPLSPADKAAYTVEDQARMMRARNYFAWQANLVRPELGRRVIEIGCGLGNFTEMLLDRDLVIAIDEEPECIERLIQRYPAQSNLRPFAIKAGPDNLAHFARFKPDSCVCLNVLEHIEYDLGTLRAIRSILIKGGVIALLVPALPALYGPIDRNLGHYRRYTRRGLKDLAQASGLRIRKLRYVNSLGLFGWWINAHLSKREAQSERQIEFFDRYIVPVLSRVETVVPPPFGQSLFAVFETA